MTIGRTSSEATLEVQSSGDQMKCRSKPLAKECKLIATPIHHACSEQQTTKKGKIRLRFQWTVELKNDLLEMYTSVKDQTGYMKKLKEMWDAQYPDHKHLAANNLSDNARRLTKPKIVPQQ